jgi:hypothetical protein
MKRSRKKEIIWVYKRRRQNHFKNVIEGIAFGLVSSGRGHKNNGLCEQAIEQSVSVRGENVFDLMRNHWFLQKDSCYMKFLEYFHHFDLFAERWVMCMMRGRAAAQIARRRLLTPNIWVQPRLRVLLGIVALKQIYYEYIQHLPVTHHSTTAPYSHTTSTWGVRQPWPGSTLSHPQVL